MDDNFFFQLFEVTSSPQYKLMKLIGDNIQSGIKERESIGVKHEKSIKKLEEQVKEIDDKYIKTNEALNKISGHIDNLNNT